MVYEDREDEFMSASEEQDLYEPDRYDENLVDTFREQIPGDSSHDEAATDDLVEDEPDMGGPVVPPVPDALSGMPTGAPQDFGESLNPDAADTRVEDGLTDEELAQEARRDYREEQE